MKYYQVKAEKDGSRVNPKGMDFLIANEIYTENQISKMNLDLNFIEKHFNPCHTSKFNTYYFFGARFAKANTLIYY